MKNLKILIIINHLFLHKICYCFYQMIGQSINFGTVRFEFGTYSTIQVIVFLTKISIMT
jgi:hypothetical protein